MENFGVFIASGTTVDTRLRQSPELNFTFSLRARGLRALTTAAVCSLTAASCRWSAQHHYAAITTQVIHYCMGGLGIDDKSAVLGTDFPCQFEVCSRQGKLPVVCMFTSDWEEIYFWIVWVSAWQARPCANGPPEGSVKIRGHANLPVSRHRKWYGLPVGLH